LAQRLQVRLRACHAAVLALPASEERTAALNTLRRHAAAARVLTQQHPTAAAVRKARRALARRST